VLLLQEHLRYIDSRDLTETPPNITETHSDVMK